VKLAHSPAVDPRKAWRRTIRRESGDRSHPGEESEPEAGASASHPGRNATCCRARSQGS
jgi:hypothetical protein